MSLVASVVLFLHLLGFAALVGGCLVQWRDETPEVNVFMLYGSISQFVTGVGLFALLLGTPAQPNHFEMGAKFGLSVLLVLLCVANRRFESMPRGVWAIITGLAVASAAVATIWR